MENGVYVYKNNKWVDCKDGLLIRRGNGTPTVSNVPKIYVYNNGWKEIYPRKG